ncbi:MAG: HNH endonuclease [Erysipelotrichia bacterium]|nr:HNH endonuclease [Erysipelotrichia bacterium]
MKCRKCKIDFPENLLESSHDIPKYMGGKDKDGRHWLCKECHRIYEEEIVKKCINNLGLNFDLDKCRLSYYQVLIKNRNNKEEFIQIAKNFREEYFK